MPTRIAPQAPRTTPRWPRTRTPQPAPRVTRCASSCRRCPGPWCACRAEASVGQASHPDEDLAVHPDEPADLVSAPVLPVLGEFGQVLRGGQLGLEEVPAQAGLLYPGGPGARPPFPVLRSGVAPHPGAGGDVLEARLVRPGEQLPPGVGVPAVA